MPAPGEDGFAAWRSFLTAHALALRSIERDLEEAGLPPLGWYDVLWALRRSPRRRLRISELADSVVLSRTGMSRLVDRLEATGLLRREAVPEDGRGAYAVLTDDGLALLRRMWPVYARGIERCFLERLADDADVVRAALDRVSAAAREA